jgi:hypothetical protein
MVKNFSSLIIRVVIKMQGSFEKMVAARMVKELRFKEAGRSSQCLQISQFNCFKLSENMRNVKLLRWDAVQPNRSLPTFRTSLLLPSSLSKS